MDNLFSTHPSTENRIAALNELAREMGSVSSTRGSYAPRPAGGPWGNVGGNAGGSSGPWG
jgi:heat shock protein HtpX